MRVIAFHEYLWNHPSFTNNLFLSGRKLSSLQIHKKTYGAVIWFFSFEDMKSKDLQNRVLSAYKDGQSCKKIHENLHGSLGLSTIERWCKMIRDTSRLTLLKSACRLRTIKTKSNVPKVTHRHNHLRVFSSRKIARDLRISPTSAQRMNS